MTQTEGGSSTEAASRTEAAPAPAAAGRPWRGRVDWSDATTRYRLVVVVLAIAALVPKLMIATYTYGTEDVHTWIDFANGVRAKGPVGIYSINFPARHQGLYNHPPFIGYYLWGINRLRDHGISLGFTIRALSSTADVFSAVLLFELLRRRVSLSRATWSAALIGLSPVLFLVSGYHGNTDPLFVMFILLGTFLLLDTRLGLLGGAALAMAISIKIVPIVVLPTLLVYLVLRRRERLVQALAGFIVVFAVIWAPAILREWGPLRHNVLGYSGIQFRQWGLVELASTSDSAHLAHSISTWLVGPGKTMVLLIAAFGPALLIIRRPAGVLTGVAVSLVALLALSPAFGVQYLAWAVAAAYCINFTAATAYNLVAGVFLFETYNSWAGGLPWDKIAHGSLFTLGEQLHLLVVWFALVVLLYLGVRSMLLQPKEPSAAGHRVSDSIAPPATA